MPGVSISQKYISFLQDAPTPNIITSKWDEIYNVRESVYMANITVGGQQFLNVIDTGSSDTWLVSQKYVCLNHSSPRKEIADQKICRFGKPYMESRTFEPINDQHYNISYIDGEFLNGPMGRETISLAGVTVEKQEFGLINLAAWSGDGWTSGLTGLAFPSVTRAYPGTDPKKDVKGLSYKYDPLLTSMIKKKLVPPLFSVALNRSWEKPGALAIGGLPGGSIKHTNDWVRTPMQYLRFNRDSNDPKRPNDYQFYIIEVDGWDLPRQVFNKDGQDIAKKPQKMILDTGSTLTQLPPALAAAINGGNAWSPPAWLNNDTNQWMVDCNAKPPKIGTKFGSKTLYFGAEDLVFTGRRDLCVSGIQPGSAFIAGGSFLKSILAVFDIGAAEIRLAQRVR